MTIYTTPTVPAHDTFGVVTAEVSCLRNRDFQFDQAILDELNQKLEQAAKAKGANAVVGVSYQLMMPKIAGYVQFQMSAIGTAVKT
ncbi:MAG: heavy metal-binding domain-containing protein [Hyphomicrobiales bacterium]